MSKFFNPGFKWEERKSFENPVKENNSSNLSYIMIKAPKNDFFEVPDTQTVNAGGEEFEVPLRLKDYVRTQYAAQGVILIVPGRECGDMENVAASEDEARKKGHRIWKRFMTEKCNEWIRIVNEARAMGAIPRPAEGLFAHCLEAMGIADPADVATGLSTAQEGQKDNKDLQAQIATLTAQVNQLIGAKSAQKV